MTAEREGLAEIAGMIYAHGIEVEHRAYPAYACACEKWDGAMGDNGGPEDGNNDTELGHARHVADALADLLAARDRRVRAEAVREYRDALAENESAEFWSTREDFLHDLSDWAKCTEEGIA